MQVPKESCHLSFSSPKPGKKPLLTKWCLDDDDDDEEDEEKGDEVSSVFDDNSLETLEGSADGRRNSLETDVFDLSGVEGQDNPDVTGLLDVAQEVQVEEQPTYGKVDLDESVYSFQAETVGQFYGAPRETRGSVWGEKRVEKENKGDKNKNKNMRAPRQLQSHSQISPKQFSKTSKQKQLQRFPNQERSSQQPRRKRPQASGARKQGKVSGKRKEALGKSRVSRQLAQSSRAMDLQLGYVFSASRGNQPGNHFGHHLGNPHGNYHGNHHGNQIGKPRPATRQHVQSSRDLAQNHGQLTRRGESHGRKRSKRQKTENSFVRSLQPQ